MASKPEIIEIYDATGLLKIVTPVRVGVIVTTSFRITNITGTRSTETTATSFCNSYSPFRSEDYAPVKLDAENKTQQKKNNPAYQQLKRGTKGKIKRW